MADIFLSYKSEDRDQTGVVAAALQAEGFTVWWDPVLRTGETYDETIERELRAAHVIVVLWTPRSVVSRWVRAEATIADRRGALAPVMLEPCERPIAFELVQAADLIGWTGNRADPRWRTLVGELKDRVTQARGQAQNPNAAPAPDPLTIETLFWSSIKDSADQADFETYLQRYPHGHFAELAQNRLAGLSRSAGPAAPVPSAKTAPPARQAPSQPSEKILWGHFAALLCAVAALGASTDVVYVRALMDPLGLISSFSEYELINYSRNFGWLAGGFVAVLLAGVAGRRKGVLLLGLSVLVLGSAWVWAANATSVTGLLAAITVFNVLTSVVWVLVFLSGLRLFPERRALIAATALVAATIAVPGTMVFEIPARAGLDAYAIGASTGLVVSAIWMALLRWPPPPPASQERPPALVTWAILLAGSGYTACQWLLVQSTGQAFDRSTLYGATLLASLAGLLLGSIVAAVVTRGGLRSLVVSSIVCTTIAFALSFLAITPWFFANLGVWLSALVATATGLGVMLAMVWRTAGTVARPWVIWLYCALPPTFWAVASNNPFGIDPKAIGLAGLLLAAILIAIGRLALPKTMFRN